MSIDAPEQPAPPQSGTVPEAAASSNGRPAAARPRRPVGVMDVAWFLPRLLHRILMPRLVDRYVMGELLAPLGFGWSLFIVLFVLSLNLYRLVQMIAAGAPLPSVVEMVGLRVVLSSVYCLPMAMLLSGLMAFGRLSGDSELIAMQAGGIRNLRVVSNAFLLGLILSFAGLAINEYIIPPAGKRLHVLQDSVKAQLAGKVAEELSDQKAFVLQDFDQKKLSRVVIARKFEPAEAPRPAVMRGVTYMQYDTERDNQVQLIVEAERAEYVGRDEKERGKVVWRFFDARTQLMGEFTGGQRWRVAHKELDLTLNKSPEKISREQKDADQMTYRELKSHIVDLKKNKVKAKVIREMEVELERKLAVPFAAVVLAMIGAPLGIRRQRSTAGVGIGLSLLIIVFYYVGMSFLGVLGQNGQIEPLAAAWGCNAAGLLVGLYLTWRSS